MTTTTFTASRVDSDLHTVLGPKDKKVRLTLLFPASWTAAGVALDMTAAALGGFTQVTEFNVGPGSLITDGEVVLNLFGTKHATDGSIGASATVGAHWGGGAGAALDATANTTDLSAIVAQAVTVHGY